MSSRRTCSRSIARLAVLGTLALVAGQAAAATAATAAGPGSASGGPALSSQAPAQVPTLTNGVGQRGGGAERQLPVGIGLLALGLLALACGAAMTRVTPRGSRPRAALRERPS